jgi:mannonate dehydratase
VQKQQEEAARYGITIDAYAPPPHLRRDRRVTVPNIMLGRSPERDREIETIQEMIRAAGRPGCRG